MIGNKEPPQGKPCGIYCVGVEPSGGSFDRKFIIPSGLIPTIHIFILISTTESRGVLNQTNE